MRHRLATLAAAGAVTMLLTTGCGAVSPGHSAAEQFEEHFTSNYPDVVLEAVTTASDKWPWVGGEMGASLVLADDTPPDLLSTILDEVITWQPDTKATYDGVGVMANGVCISGSDSQQAQKHLLRDRLYAEGLALEGAWACPTWVGRETMYAGTLEQLMQDSETVRNIWDETDGALRVVANVNTPYGSVDHAWIDVPETLPAVLTAIGQEHPVKTFELTDAGLRIAVSATTRVAELQTLADSVAGPDLIAEVMQGSLDAEKAAQIDELAAVVEQVRAVPGVTGADVLQPGTVVIGVESREAIPAAHEAAVTHPDLGSASVEITLGAQDPDNEWARHRYFWQPGGTDAALETFIDLTQHEAVSIVQLSNRATPGVTVTLAMPLAEGFAQLKDVLPDGMAVTVKGNDAHATVEFTAARTLEPQDLESRFTTPNLKRLASDWNEAGSD